jgi:hypothetical protein
MKKTPHPRHSCGRFNKCRCCNGKSVHVVFMLEILQYPKSPGLDEFRGIVDMDEPQENQKLGKMQRF